MRGTKYLNEIMEDIELSTEKNNLILAPIGSGKTYYCLESLMTDKNKKYLYLCDNVNLKKQMLNEKSTYSTKKDSTRNKFSPNVLVMSYKEFGYKILYDINYSYASQFDLIVADEIHSCVEYSEFNRDRELSKSIEFLMTKHDTPIIMMTATDYYLQRLCENYPTLNTFNVINLLSNKEIRRYIDKVKLYINNISQIKFYLQQSLEAFKYGGLKAGIYTKQISDMKDIETMCIDLGLNPICIWSEKNKDYKLSDEQIEFMDDLIEHGTIKNPYNIFIFNKATETGINITDDNVDLCIVNSTNMTEQIQARGRFRKDINLIVVRTKSDALPEMTITLDESYLNRWLIKDDMHSIIEALKIKNSRSKLIGLRSFISILRNSKYKVESNRKQVNNKQSTYYYITKGND